VAATLVGCSHQPPYQTSLASCADQHAFPCLGRTVADPATKFALFKPASSSKQTKSSIAVKNERPPPQGAHNAAHHFTKTAKSSVAAEAEPSANRIPLPRPSLRKRSEPKVSVAAASGTAGANFADSHAAVGVAPNSNDRTLEEQVAAATAVADRVTVATAGDNAEPIAGSAHNKDLLVAIVLARPDIRNVSDLAGKSIAIDDKYSASSVDVRIAIVAAGAPEAQLSGGQTTAMNRLVNGEVPAAVLALVSADAAEGFPDISGFRTFRIPLSPRPSKK